MRFGTRIFSFLAVGFLLSFFGKVSKTDLFHVYIRTIQDVGERNSTEISHYEDQPVQAVASQSGAETHQLFSSPGFQAISSFFSIGEEMCIARNFLAQAFTGRGFSGFYFLSAQFTSAP